MEEVSRIPLGAQVALLQHSLKIVPGFINGGRFIRKKTITLLQNIAQEALQSGKRRRAGLSLDMKLEEREQWGNLLRFVDRIGWVVATGGMELSPRKHCLEVNWLDPTKTFQVVTVLPSREFEEDDPLGMEYRKAEGHFLRMQKDGLSRKLEIKSIDIVKNMLLKERFNAKKTMLASQGCGHSLLLFHGTPHHNIPAILRNNFNLSMKANGRN